MGFVIVLGVVCEGGPPQIKNSDVFFHDFGEIRAMGNYVFNIQSELASLSPNAYCNIYGGNEELTLHAYLFIIASIVSVISQMAMVSSLGAEWERATEELHYMQGFQDINAIHDSLSKETTHFFTEKNI